MKYKTPCHYLPRDVGLFSCSDNDTDACLISDILDSIYSPSELALNNGQYVAKMGAYDRYKRSLCRMFLVIF